MPGFAISGKEKGQNPNYKAEFHRAHRWMIEDIGVPMSSNSNNNVGGTQTRGGFNASGMASKGDLKLYAKSLKLPSLSFEEVKVNAGSLTYSFPKKAKWENVVVEFYDVYGLHQIFRDWQDKIWTPDEGMKIVDAYMGEPIFKLLDGQGKEQQKFTLKNSYPINVDHGELSYDSSDVKLLIVTYVFSHAVIEIKDRPTSSGPGPVPTAQDIISAAQGF
tara:strand:+ start:13037 stop:13690 length:654 start_codon:yes stop_codon:yes gene_type:complete